MPLSDGRETPEEYEERRARNEERRREREANGDAKRALIYEARSAARITDWKAGGDAMRDLMVDWRSIGPADRDENQSLWEDFQAARQVFFNARQEAFSQRDRERAVNKSIKQALINRASRISFSGDWKEGGEQMRDLMAEWKETGSAGKEDNDALWRDFQAHQQAFFTARKSFYDRRDKERVAAKSAKQKLIAEVRSITFSPSDWQVVHERLQNIREEWKQAGRAGKDDEDALWSEFRIICDKFYKSWDSHKQQQRAARSKEPYKFGESPEEKRSMKKALRQFSGHGERYNRFIDGLEKPFELGNNHRGKHRDWYSAATEIGRNEAGKEITRVDVGTKAYVVTTHKSGKWGKTTGHPDGTIHHHGAHSSGPRKSNHFVKADGPPDGPNIGKIIKNWTIRKSKINLDV